ncbi:MAG: hypothetical protein MJ056_01065 [Akkermansia sp.]|nr:hypothetical protein [Akkermansia sp.]
MSTEFAKIAKKNVKKQEKQKRKTTEKEKSCSERRQECKIPAPGNWPGRII